MSLAIVETRTFATNVVLCVATKMIPDARMMSEIYQLLDFLTGAPVATAQLASAMHESNRFLAFRKPELLEGWIAAQSCPEATSDWVARKVADLGEALTVARN